MKVKNSKVTRAYNFEIRAEANESHGTYITGRPIVYGAKTDMGYFDEVIEPGALNLTDLKDVRFLVNHNTDMIPLARSRNNNENSTMQFEIDLKGCVSRELILIQRTMLKQKHCIQLLSVVTSVGCHSCLQ